MKFNELKWFLDGCVNEFFYIFRSNTNKFVSDQGYIYV